MGASRSSKVLSLSLAQGIMTVVSVISGMVFARYLSVKDYGTYLQTFMAYDFATPILTLGLPSALYYFLPRTNEEKQLVLGNMFLLFLAGFIFSIFLFFGGTNLLAKRFNNPDLTYTLKWLTLYPLYTFPVVLSAVLIVKDKVKLNAQYSIVSGLVLTVGLISAAIIGKNYQVPTLVRIIIPIFFFPIAVHLSFKYLKGAWRYPSLSSMGKILKFSIPLGLATVLGTLTLQLSNIIVSSICTPEDFAIYANGARELPFIGIITGSISVVIMADMSFKIKERDLKSALELFRKSSAMGALFLIPIMIFLMIFAESAIDILYSDKYENSVLPFRIFLFFLPVRIVIYGSALIAFGKTKAVLYRSFISLILTAVFCYLLTKWIGYIGAAMGAIIVSYIWGIPYNLVTLGKEFGCKPLYIIPFKEIGKTFIISTISGLISSIIFLFELKPIFQLCFGISIFFIVYCLISYNYSSNFTTLALPYALKLKKYIGK